MVLDMPPAAAEAENNNASDQGGISDSVHYHTAASVEQKPTQLYRHYDADGALLYVGISLYTVKRLIEHRERSPWFTSIARITVETFPSRDAALAAESAAIRTERPRDEKFGAIGDGNIGRAQCGGGYFRATSARRCAALLIVATQCGHQFASFTSRSVFRFGSLFRRQCNIGRDRGN
jgi:hypothetical protein